MEYGLRIKIPMTTNGYNHQNLSKVFMCRLYTIYAGKIAVLFHLFK